MKKQPYDFNQPLKFGKHKGVSIEKIICFEPEYIIWCLENIEGFYLTNSCIIELKKEVGRIKVSIFLNKLSTDIFEFEKESKQKGENISLYIKLKEKIIREAQIKFDNINEEMKYEREQKKEHLEQKKRYMRDIDFQREINQDFKRELGSFFHEDMF